MSSTVGRRRSQLMAAGLAGLGGGMVVAISTGAVTDGDIGPAVVLGAMSVVSFLLGFMPPQALRWSWSRRDRAALDAAEMHLLRADDPQELVRTLLPHVNRLVGGEIGWLTSQGEIVGHVGVRDDGLVELTPSDAPAAGEVRIVQVPDAQRWLVAASTGRGWLVTVVGPYPLLFGAQDLDAVRSLAVRLEVAVDRARLRERERESIRRYEERGEVLAGGIDPPGRGVRRRRSRRLRGRRSRGRSVSRVSRRSDVAPSGSPRWSISLPGDQGAGSGSGPG